MEAGETVERENTCYFKPVGNDHKELATWRLQINVRSYLKETMKYTQILMYMRICCSIIYNNENFKAIYMPESVNLFVVSNSLRPHGL